MSKKKADHPAKFTNDQIDHIAGVLEEEFDGKKVKILDPFAGVGIVHDLAAFFGHKVTSIEIEKEWAAQCPYTICANSIKWMTDQKASQFSAIVTSYVFPNRMTDHHNAKDGSKRHSYKHYLGRDPSPGSNATLGWGKESRKFYRKAFKLMIRSVKRDGVIIIDSKNFYKDKTLVLFNEWTIRQFAKLGCPLLQVRPVIAAGLRHGKNYDERVDRHLILVFRVIK